MKVGVVTFWWSNDNYGQLLQAYALQMVLIEMGHEPYIIKYDRRKDVDHSLKARIKTLREILLKVGIKKMFFGRSKLIEDNSRSFSKFRDSRLNFSKLYTTYEELKKDPPVADVYIVGSDQVWYFPSESFYKLKNWANVYFLNFGSENIKRIAYAASFSLKTVSSDFCRFVTPLLKRFSLVTVRETTGIPICRECMVKTPILALDPTLLLTSEQWKSIARKVCPKNMLLCYFLGNECDIPFDEIHQFSHNGNWDEKIIASQGQKTKIETITPSIEEFLSLIGSSKFVITNSFHGAVFSIIFNIRFLIIPLCGKFQSMNDRFFTLLKMFKIESRVYSRQVHMYEQMQQYIDWESVNKILSQRRKEMFDLLNSYI